MDIEQEIIKLKERNSRVENDKAWEISWTRIFFISLTTYLVATTWLYYIEEQEIWLKSVIPTAGYILSTISIPQLKKIWLKYRKQS